MGSVAARPVNSGCWMPRARLATAAGGSTGIASFAGEAYVPQTQALNSFNDGRSNPVARGADVDLFIVAVV